MSVQSVQSAAAVAVGHGSRAEAKYIFLKLSAKLAATVPRKDLPLAWELCISGTLLAWASLTHSVMVWETLL